jgi:hypothetical protein
MTCSGSCRVGPRRRSSVPSVALRAQILDAHRRVAEIQEAELQKVAHQIVGPDHSELREASI